MSRSTSPWWVPGALLILFGVTIVIFPELLALMVASFFILAGAFWLSMAYGARKLRREASQQIYQPNQWRWF
jgi:hypothetical protein